MSQFSINSERLLEVTLQNEKVMAIAGSMVAYTGNMKFEKAILGGEGLFGALKRKVTNEGMSLMQTLGTGKVFFAHNAAEIAVIPLNQEKLFIESSSLLAYDAALKTNTSFAGLRGAASGQGNSAIAGASSGVSNQPRAAASQVVAMRSGAAKAQCANAATRPRRSSGLTDAPRTLRAMASIAVGSCATLGDISASTGCFRLKA